MYYGHERLAVKIRRDDSSATSAAKCGNEKLIPRCLVSDNNTAVLREFLYRKFPLMKKRNIRDTDDLLQSGIVESMGVLEIVAFLECNFAIAVDDEDLTPENFQSVERIAAFVKSKSYGIIQSARP
jgi:acyl carrier protein